MTQDEIIEMWQATSRKPNHIEAFAKLVAAKEREACAKLVEVSDGLEDWEIICGSEGRELLNEMAKAIRARA